MKSITRWDSKTGKRIAKEIEFSHDELEIAIEKINVLHLHGFGAGLTEKELDIINSDAVGEIRRERGLYGPIYGEVLER